ncbi:MAG: F0F1 ATP synthase subunit epsilon [Bacteroidetes bacterium]|nr:F0F1 ATP synthase subunit epsilon [Bacteroidota bacterium]
MADDKTFKVEVITPQKVVFNGEVIGFFAPGVLGSFEILKNHTAFITSMKIGELCLRHPDGYDEYYATSGGFVDVHENKVLVLAETCERAADIDVNRAKAAHDKARKKLEERSNYDLDQVTQALLRATNRLRIAEEKNKKSP